MREGTILEHGMLLGKHTEPSLRFDILVFLYCRRWIGGKELNELNRHLLLRYSRVPRMCSPQWLLIVGRLVTSLGATLYAAPFTLASFAAWGQGIMLTKAPTFYFLCMAEISKSERKAT